MIVFALGTTNLNACVFAKVVCRLLTHETNPTSLPFSFWFLKFFLNFADVIIYDQSNVIFSLDSLVLAFYEFWHLLRDNFLIK